MFREIEELSLIDKEKAYMVQKLLSMGQTQSTALAAHVVSYRILGIEKEISICCMAELALRRDLGEEFDFESFIENEIKKIPKIPSNLNILNWIKP